MNGALSTSCENNAKGSGRFSSAKMPTEDAVKAALAPYNVSCGTEAAWPVQMPMNATGSSSSLLSSAGDRLTTQVALQNMRKAFGGALYYEIQASAACHAPEKPKCGFGHPNHDCPFYVYRPGGSSSLHANCDLRRREKG